MGFLDNSSVTVDAILTKRGREILAAGGDLNITKFALSDEEIDYTLYDVTHPNGTDSYGAVIENMSQSINTKAATTVTIQGKESGLVQTVTLGVKADATSTTDPLQKQEVVRKPNDEIVTYGGRR